MAQEVGEELKEGKHTVPGAELDINSGLGCAGECELDRLGPSNTWRFKCWERLLILSPPGSFFRLQSGCLSLLPLPV